jgi:hypothetical protein
MIGQVIDSEICSLRLFDEIYGLYVIEQIKDDKEDYLNRIGLGYVDIT